MINNTITGIDDAFERIKRCVNHMEHETLNKAILHTGEDYSKTLNYIKTVVDDLDFMCERVVAK